MPKSSEFLEDEDVHEELTSGRRSSSDNNNFLSKCQVAVPTVVAGLKKINENTPLPDEFTPGDFDVVCGRGKGSYNRPGNKRFRAIVQLHIADYVNAKNRYGKSNVLSEVLERVRSQAGGSARFVKCIQQKWYEISEEEAREKVGHTMRESIMALDQNSSKQAKKKSTAWTQVDCKRRETIQQQQQFGHLNKAQAPPRPNPVTSDLSVPSAGDHATAEARGKRQSDAENEYDNLF